MDSRGPFWPLRGHAVPGHPSALPPVLGSDPRPRQPGAATRLGGTRSVASETYPATPASPCEAGFAAREEGTERGPPGALAGRS
jgi:hypothetical protein